MRLLPCVSALALVLAGGEAARGQESISWNLVGQRYLRDIHVFEDGTVVGIDRYDVVRSTDGGVTWVPTFGDQRLYDLEVDPAGALFVAGWPGVYRSFDAALTWARVRISAASGDPGNCQPPINEHLALSVGRDGSLLVIGNYDQDEFNCHPSGFVQRTPDQGQTWSFGYSTLNAHPVLALEGNLRLMGSGNSVIRCGGGMGCVATQVGAAIGAFARVSQAEGSALYAGTSGQNLSEWKADTLGSARGNGAYRSLDDGVTWARAGDGLTDSTITALIALVDGRVLAGTYEGGVHITEGPEGRTWIPVNAGLPEGSARSIHAFAVAPDGRVYAATKAGLFRTTGPVVAAEGGATVPQEATLLPLRPNPSSSRVMVRYSLHRSSPVRLELLDVTGRTVAVLYEGTKEAGSYEAAHDTSQLAPGVYVVRLSAEGAVSTRQLAVVR